MEDWRDPLTLLSVGLKLMQYVACLLAAGFALALSSGVIEAPSRRAWLKPATWLALVACIVALLRLFLSAAQLGDMNLLAMVWDMQHRSVLALGAGLFILTAALFSGGVLLRGLTCVSALCLSTSFALTGHTQALESPALFSFLVAGHVAIAAFWVSAPAVLWPHPEVNDTVLLARTQQFGAVALVCVPLLFVGGGILGWKLGGGYTGLTTSTYGQALGFKLCCALAALGLGAVNKLRISTLLRTRIAQGRRELQQTLTLDGMLFVFALLAITLATTIMGPPTA
jgi:copper resistance protein D